MTATAQNLLAAFDALSPDEQQQVAAEILRRTAGTGDLPEAALDELAAELFRAYEAKEAGRAGTCHLSQQQSDTTPRRKQSSNNGLCR